MLEVRQVTRGVGVEAVEVAVQVLQGNEQGGVT